MNPTVFGRLDAVLSCYNWDHVDAVTDLSILLIRIRYQKLSHWNNHTNTSSVSVKLRLLIIMYDILNEKSKFIAFLVQFWYNIDVAFIFNLHIFNVWNLIYNVIMYKAFVVFNWLNEEEMLDSLTTLTLFYRVQPKQKMYRETLLKDI